MRKGSSRFSFFVVVVFMFLLLPGSTMAKGRVSASGSSGALTQAEKAGIVKVMLNEKLARDVCEAMYGQWETCEFYRMSFSKKRDMEQIEEFLTSHMIPDPLKGYGVGSFPSQRLRDIYQKMIVKGQRSLADAIEVCSSIERSNVKLIDRCLRKAQDPSLRDLLKRLLLESQSHVKMFSKCLKNLGVAGSIHYPCL